MTIRFISKALLFSAVIALSSCEAVPGICNCPPTDTASETPNTIPVTPPTLEQVVVQTKENGSENGDVLILSFSEKMTLDTTDADSINSATHADNYIVQVNDGTEMSWGTDLKGVVAQDPTDSKRLILQLIRPNTDNAFLPGQSVHVSVLPRVQDAQGHVMDPTKSKLTVNAS